MKLVTVTTMDQDLFEKWKRFLDEHKSFYESGVSSDGTTYKISTHKRSAQLLEQYRSTGKAPMTMRNAPKWLRTTAYVLLALVILLGITIAATSTGSSGDYVPPSPEQMTEQQYIDYLDTEYGYYSMWVYDYGKTIREEYAKYPRTFEVEQVRVIPITRDSFTHVLTFSAENAFGVPQDHSITAVVNTKTGAVQRIVSAH